MESDPSEEPKRDRRDWICVVFAAQLERIAQESAYVVSALAVELAEI
jgi:hypothetical protein